MVREYLSAEDHKLRDFSQRFHITGKPEWLKMVCSPSPSVLDIGPETVHPLLIAQTAYLHFDQHGGEIDELDVVLMDEAQHEFVIGRCAKLRIESAISFIEVTPDK